MVIALTAKGRESFRAYIDHIEDLMRDLTRAGYGLPRGGVNLAE